MEAKYGPASLQIHKIGMINHDMHAVHCSLHHLEMRDAVCGNNLWRLPRKVDVGLQWAYKQAQHLGLLGTGQVTTLLPQKSAPPSHLSQMLLTTITCVCVCVS